jgi:3',5'-nucleoside bisphosphate phosphatase
MRFDLQSHSTASDGALEPAAVVAGAAQAGVELLALTDHDTVEGVPHAAATARELGMRLTAAAEISAVDGAHEDLHVVGYELDVGDPELLATLEQWRGDRERRVLAMVDRMRELGFSLDTTVLDERRAAGRPLGRPHLADAVLAHPDNALRLRDEGIVGKDELFPAYLVPGAPGYVFRTVPSVADAISTIHAAGGVAVWAHPFWDLDDAATTLDAIDRFAAAGLDGVEVFYPTHDEEQTRLLHAATAGRGLLITGSSDFHAPDHDRFGRFLAFETYGLEPRLGPIGA